MASLAPQLERLAQEEDRILEKILEKRRVAMEAERDAVERAWREQGAKLWRSLVAFTALGAGSQMGLFKVTMPLPGMPY